jgi:hypothetical protein
VHERRSQLLETAERQITELLALLSATDHEVLHRPCPGREKLDDGTIGAVARHTADNYVRIAAFVQTIDTIPRREASGSARGSTGSNSAHRPVQASRPPARRLAAAIIKAGRLRLTAVALGGGLRTSGQVAVTWYRATGSSIPFSVTSCQGS